jgi:hypothetical protein
MFYRSSSVVGRLHSFANFGLRAAGAICKCVQCGLGFISFSFEVGKNKINSINFTSCQKAKSFLISILSLSSLAVGIFFTLVQRLDNMPVRDWGVSYQCTPI